MSPLRLAELASALTEDNRKPRGHFCFGCNTMTTKLKNLMKTHHQRQISFDVSERTRCLW